MKKLMYLFVAAIMFAFTACGGGETVTKKVDVETVVNCGDYCKKACCLGCKSTEGAAKCIVLEDGSMPCCIVKSAEAAHNHDDDHSQEH